MANIIKTTLEDANDVLTYNNRASFPSSGESGKLYIAADTKYTYFWNGSSYVETRGSGYASSSHTHDDRYYTESEVDSKLGSKANSSEVVKLTGNQDIYGTKTFKDRITNTYLVGGVLDTHPEAGGTIIGYYTNDLAYHLIRGGTCVARNVTQNSTITVPNTWFDCSPTYGGFRVTSTSDVVEIILKLPPSMSNLAWTTYGGIGFGSANWRAKDVKIETGYSATNTGTASNPDTDIVWRTTINVTNQGKGIVQGLCSGPTKAQGGHPNNSVEWSYMRLTLTNWNNTTPRIAQIYAVNYGSWGMHNAFLSKTGGNIYGSITPALNNTYWLGNSDKKWARIYGTEIYQNANKVIDASNIGSQTVNKSKYLISPSDVPTNANISDKENTNKAKLRVDLATSSMTTNKPVDDGFIYTNIWDINNSKNNNSQLYIPNGYHITNGRRLSVRGCKDDTWQTSWKELAYMSDLDNYVPEKNMLADNINLNTIITSGFYRLQAISTHINGIDISYGQMIVCQGGHDTIAQLVFPYTSSKILLRTGYPVNNPGGKWNDWKTVALTDEIPTYSAGTGLSLNNTNNTFSVKTGYTTDANNRNYKVAADSNGNLYVNVPWSSSGTLDSSLSSTSTNALQNKTIYSAFDSAVGYDTNYYFYGEIGSWRLRQYNTTGNSLDIKYGVIAINSQSANYSVSFSGKNFNSTNYTVVFGLYRSNTQSWFWSPIVQSKTVSGFTVFLRGNSGGDNGGTIMYLAIRSN